jgi:hypothetical protein
MEQRVGSSVNNRRVEEVKVKFLLMGVVVGYRRTDHNIKQLIRQELNIVT